MDTPFVHLLKSPYHHYMYDVNTNSIIRISKGCYQALEHPEKEVTDEAVQGELASLREKGLLKTKKVKKLEHHLTDQLEYLNKHKVENLLLQVTQQCNLRCTYCFFTIGEEAANRPHAPKFMSEETAFRAVDYFYEHSRDCDEILISFYGGEPMLAMNLIRKVIAYAEDKFEGKPLRFIMTTNGTLLTPERARYLYEHHMQIMVSLDGPKEIHDANRKFASDGTGTYDTVYSNLMAIREQVPEAFAAYMFNSVVDPELPFDNINRFFTCGDLENNLKHNSLVNLPDGVEMQLSPEYQRDSAHARFLSLLGVAGISEVYLQNTIAVGLYGMYKLHKKRKITCELPDTVGHSGPCVPGSHRLFVSVDGNFFPCERVSETLPDNCIGSLDSGLDLEKARNLINLGQVVGADCMNCWAISLCTMCAGKIKAAHIGHNEVQELCSIIKHNAISDLSALIIADEAEAMVRGLTGKAG